VYTIGRITKKKNVIKLAETNIKVIEWVKGLCMQVFIKWRRGCSLSKRQ
jgi:hypothetical protein